MENQLANEKGHRSRRPFWCYAEAKVLIILLILPFRMAERS